TISHLVVGFLPLAPGESAVMLSETPKHGGVADVRQDQQRSRLAGGRTFCVGSSRQASSPPATTVAGPDGSCAGQGGKPIPATCGDWAATMAAFASLTTRG